MRDVAAGANHTVALKQDGTVTAWGENRYGECNVPQGLGPVKAVAAGCGYTVAVSEDGTVVAWGTTTQGSAACLKE